MIGIFQHILISKEFIGKASAFYKAIIYPFRSFIIFLLVTFPSLIYSQQNSEDEILLTFRHPAVGHIYVNSLHNESSGITYLPILELFTQFGIYYNPDISNFIVEGTYLKNDLTYSIDLKRQIIKLGEKEFQLNAEDFRLGTLDFFLSPAIFEKVFSIHFSIDIYQLTLSMESEFQMPIQEQKKREVMRKKMNENNQENKEFPLLYKYKKHWLQGGMLDYGLSSEYSGLAQSLNYTLGLGIEFLGGDLQLRAYGIKSNATPHEFRLSNVRWKYAIFNTPIISNITLGKISTTGLSGKSILGGSISNEPIEPRRTFNTYTIDGNTEANSEVELYENDRLIEFKRADELGYYRFDIPLNYGTSRLRIHIYTYTGQTIVIDRQIDVPYNFIPQGKIQYQMQAGVPEADKEIYGDKAIISNANVGYGLTNWLSANAGGDYISNSLEKKDPFIYGSLNARVAGQFLFKLDMAPEAFYRFASSVAFSSNKSLNFIYTKYTGISNFNIRGVNEELAINTYFPFRLFGNNLGLRLGGEHHIMPGAAITNFQVNLTSKLGPLNMRLNYTDFITKTLEGITPGRSSLNTVFTYVVKRTPGIPVYLRGTFIRSQTSFSVRDKKIETTDLQFSKAARKNGRINLNLTYNFESKRFSASLGLVIDLKTIRSTTNFRSNGTEHSVRQSFNGSIGFDQTYKKFNLTNRDQVGRAAASVLLYVDLNNSGKYDKGDERLPYKAIKLDQSSNMKVGKDGVLRITALQAYHKYKVSVQRNAVPNPTLVPLISELSFISDPNQFKKMEIPFYRGGTIGGTISVRRKKGDEGQGGLKLIVKDVNTDYTQTIKTFSDGGFFLMDLPPGEYTLEVDPNQLRFLGSTEETKTLEFEIKALADGDFIENLDMTIFVKNKDEK